MGEAKRRTDRKRRILANHPLCCFCGGGEPATTIDHAPARTCFVRRVGPEGFEFPACKRCQEASRRDELIFGFYIRTLDTDERNYNSEDISDLMRGMRNNAPEMLPELDLPPNAKRATLREAGLTLERGQLLDDVPLVGVPVGFKDVVRMVTAKLACALHYKHLDAHIPVGHRLMIIFNQLQFPSGRELAERLVEAMPDLVVGQRGNTNIGDQFAYVWGRNEDEDLFAIGAQFSQSMFILAAAAPPSTVAAARTPEDWLPLHRWIDGAAPT